jgi:photosystem II stability/assembly factor-like uncharacterized protein
MWQRLKRISLAALLILCTESILAQNAKLYLTTFGTSYTHVGMRMTTSGLFVREALSDTSWNFLGRPNDRAAGFDVFLPAQGKSLAIASGNGIMQSWDGGQSWKETSDWKITEVQMVRFHPTNSAIIYACTPYGFYQTQNGGETWQQKNTGLVTPDQTYISAFVLSHENPDVIFAATEDGVYHSQNAGDTWQRCHLPIRNIRFIAQHPKNADWLIAATEDHGLYFTFTSGKTWEKRENGIVHQTFYTVEFDPNQPEVIYAAGFSTGIYKSVDGGDSWTQHFNGLDDLNINTIAVDPTDSQRVFTGTLGTGVFVSENGGDNWQYLGITGGSISMVNVLVY